MNNTEKAQIAIQAIAELIIGCAEATVADGMKTDKEMAKALVAPVERARAILGRIDAVPKRMARTEAYAAAFEGKVLSGTVYSKPREAMEAYLINFADIQPLAEWTDEQVKDEFERVTANTEIIRVAIAEKA